MSGVLVVQTAWLGDVVLTTPLLTALAAAHGPVDVVTTPDAAPLLAPHPAVREVIPFDKRGRDRGSHGVLRVARALRARRYAMAYLPQGSVRSALLALLARVPRRLTRAGAPGAWLCTERVTTTCPHEAERHLALAGAAGPAPLTLRLTADDHAAAAAALARTGVGRSFVALAPGSARATKRWPHFGALARALAGEVPVVFVGAPEDHRLLPSGATGGPMADLTGLPVRVSAAVIERATVVVANDSLALHLGQAVGTPVVALFGPTDPSLGFGPRGPRDVALGLDLACRPCSAHGGPRCPLDHHHCLTELAVPAVRAAVHGVLASREAACV